MNPLGKLSYDRTGQRLLVLLFAALASPLAWAQSHYLTKFDGGQACQIVDVITDAAGNAYVTGNHSSPIAVSSDGSTQGNVATAGAQDVLVAKFAPNGTMLWVQHAGGTSVDLGLKLALGPSGLALTGVFTGAANLFGTPVNAQGGSTDLFVAMLDPANGQAQWVRTAGSPGYTDTPSGITLTSTGQVVVAGKFKGDAVFGTQTLHSAINPATALPSFDVFIAAWAADGTFQWVKQGTGAKDCFAVDLVSAPDDHLYVAGQFNDTITFDVMHPNSVSSNIFVAKFDDQGNEIWFRKCGGGNYNQVSDLLWSSANDLLMTGDQDGTMYWSDGTNSTAVPSTAPHAYFILRVDDAGALIDAAAMGSTSPVHGASIAEQADSVVVFGEFECSFSGLQNAYNANGLFIATGAPDLFIARHASVDLAFASAQQFGGSDLKRAKAITAAPDGLLFVGAFTSDLFLPRGSLPWGDPTPTCAFLTSPSAPFCGDSNYSSFAWASGTGPSTGFLTKGWVEGRSPYDFWDRSGSTPCDRSAQDGSVQILFGNAVAPDSVSGCAPVALSSQAPFPRGGSGNTCGVNTPTVGPFAHQVWSNGYDGADVYITTTGWVSYTVSSNSGCRSWTDSVYVTVLVPPSLSVSDSTGTYQNTNVIDPLMITSCDPVTVFWADDLQPGDVAYWVFGTDTTFSDTVHIAASGTYDLHVIAANGCSGIGQIISVISGSVDVNITGVLSQLVGNDTINTCSAYCVFGSFSNTWYVDGVPATLPSGLAISYTMPSLCMQPGSTDANSDVPWSVALNGSGWYTIESELTVFTQVCGTDGPDLFTFTFLDSVYVNVGGTATIVFDQNEVYHCLGDTVLIPFTCTNCDSIIWTGPGVVWTSQSGDSVLVNMDGFYSATPLMLQGGSPCIGNALSVLVAAPIPPTLYMDPPTGVICANDSVQLYTDAVGIEYLWTGPGTTSLPNASSIWVNDPGDYYLSVSLYDGCVTSGGPSTVSFFGSPVLIGPPGGVICPGGTAQLEVQAGPGSIIQWQAPLSGSNPVQTITEPGTYSCSVTSCGSTWSLTYFVALSAVSADLGTDTFALCQGLPITLTAPPGAANYFWWPSGDTLPQITVSTPGVVELIVTDSAGCSASSGQVQVVEQDVPQPATATGDSLCAGETAMLTATGPGDFFWYAEADTTNLLGSGASFTYQPIGTETVFLLQMENGCPGSFLAVPVFVQDAPPTPVILGDTMYCTGDPLLLFVEGAPGVEVFWSAPWGSYTGDSIGPATASAMHSGTYICFQTSDGCQSDTATTTVLVLDAPDPPVIVGDTVLCLGDTLLLQASGSAGSQLHWTTPNGTYIGLVLEVPDMTAEDAGLYSCEAQMGGCSSDPVSHLVQLKDCGSVLPSGEIANVITPNGDGVNDVFHFAGAGFSQAELHVYNRWGQQVALVPGRNATWDGRSSYSGEVLSEGVYFYTIEAVTDAGETYRKSGYIQLLR